MLLPAFIRNNLVPVDRLEEILFGIIMALGITGAARLGIEEADHRTLFIAVLGCNVAWGLVDGVMFVLTRLFERGRQTRLVHAVQSAPDEETALRMVAQEVDDRMEMLTTREERNQIHAWVLQSVRSTPPRPVRMTRDDFLCGIAAATLVILSTLPVVVPFLVVSDAWLATRISNITGLVLLFLVGHRWARFTGSNPWKTSFGISVVGLVLVLVTIALGG